MKIYLVIAAALAGWSAQASAQDFTGPSIGVQAGWNSTDVQLPGGSNGGPGIDRSTDAFVAGGFLAYDHEVMPRVVIGAQAEFNTAASDDFSAAGDMATVRVDPRYAFDLTARVGYALRHSSIVRAIRAGLPIRLVAALHDTSTTMIEKHYSRWITEGLEDMVARAVVPLVGGDGRSVDVERQGEGLPA